MQATKATLSALRERVAVIERGGGSGPGDNRPRIALDRGEVDAALSGGLLRGSLHEIHAAPADGGAAAGFAAVLALGAAAARTIVWIRQEHAVRENGELYPDGLAELGLDPATLLLVRLRDALSVLRAGVEVARCAALGAVILEFCGEPKAFDLATQRRLLLAAEASAVTVFLLRRSADPLPGSAETRWLAGASPSAAMAANAPGRPAFALTLLRHRHGPPGGPWRLEWNRDARIFAPSPLWRDPLPLPGLGPAAAPSRSSLLRLAG